MNTVKQSKQASIRRKLMQSGIEKPHQFEQIISNLLNQRERLQTDLDLLKQKVAALQQKESHKQISRLKRPKQKINFREQLQKKYQQLRQWQKRSLKAMKNTTFQIQYRTNLDKIMSVEQQIQTAIKQLDDQYKMNKRLMKGLKAVNKDERVSNNVQSGIQQQNNLLKKKLAELRKIVDKQTTQEIIVHNHLIDIKEKERDNRDLISRNHQRKSKDLRSVRHNSKVKTQEIQSQKEQIISQLQLDEIIDLQINPSQIINKDQIYQIQGRMNRIQAKWKNAVSQIEQKIKHCPSDALNQRREGSKLTFSKQFQLIIERVKSKLNRLNQVNKTKIKLLLQKKADQNMSKMSKRSGSTLLLRQGSSFKKQITEGYESNKQRTTPLKNNSKIKIVQSKSRLKNRIQYQDVLTQTQFLEAKMLRRQYIGNIDAIVSDDRTLLKQNTSSSIKSLQIYYSDRGIATIRATYNMYATQSTLQSKLILPESFLQNICKIYVLETNSDDFIRYFKVRYNKVEKRITQIKIVTNKSIKNGWGDGKIKGQDYLQIDEQNQVDFVLDISQDEYPVSIYCSHIQKGPYWYLCGFGVQINDL